MDQIQPHSRVPIPAASMSGSYSPNAASSFLPWTSRGEGPYEGLGARFITRRSEDYSSEPRYPGQPTKMTARRQPGKRATMKRKPQLSSDNVYYSNSIIHAGDAAAMTVMNYAVPNSSGFMIPEGSFAMPQMPQTITTMQNRLYLPLPRGHIHSQGASSCSKLSACLPQTTQQLSHLPHSSLVATSTVTSVAPEMPPPPLMVQQGWGDHSSCSGHALSTSNTWAPSHAVNTSGTMLNKVSPREELSLPVPDLPDDLTDADWNIIAGDTSTTDSLGSTSGHVAKQAQAAQPLQHVLPVSQDGILSSNASGCSVSYHQQQAAQTTQNQQAEASVSTLELEQIQTAQQPQGVGVLSQNNVLASNNQAPPQVTQGVEKSPVPCLNISRGHSSSITTIDHHPDTNSPSLSGRSTTTVVAATPSYAKSQSNRTVSQKSDQLPAGSASSSHNQADQSDDDDCHTDSCNKSVQACCSPRDPILETSIERIINDDSDLYNDKELKLFRQYFHRKRKSTSLENEESACTLKNARKDSGGESDESLVPLVLLTCTLTRKGQRDIVEELRNLKDGQGDIVEELRNIKEGQRDICEQLKNMNEHLQTLSGLSRFQQVKMERSVKTETQDNFMIDALLKEESNGVRIEHCCWKDENLLKIKCEDPNQYALKLLEKLFPVEDRVGRCYRRGTRTSDKPLLDETRVKILRDCIQYRFGHERLIASESDFGERLNQKCRDAKRKFRKE